MQLPENTTLFTPYPRNPDEKIHQTSREQIRARWLSGRVIDLRFKARWFRTNLKYCVVLFSKTLYLMLKNGSALEDRSQKKSPDMTETLLTGRLRINTNKQTTKTVSNMITKQ